MNNRDASLLLAEDIRTSWKYATRAVNWCESASLPDTRQAMAEIVVKISQQLEFLETQLQAERISERREAREQAQSSETVPQPAPAEREVSK